MSSWLCATWQQRPLGTIRALPARFLRPLEQVPFPLTRFTAPNTPILGRQMTLRRPLITLHLPFSGRNFQTSSAHLARQPRPFQKSNSDNKSRFSLPPHIINRIFGTSMEKEDGNNLLAKLQKHRRDGTLDEEMPYPKGTIAAGLSYLQAKFPMDEDAAIIARIDRELDNQLRLPQTDTKHSPYGTSKLAKIRKENEERFEREEAAQKAKEKKAQDMSNISGSTDLVAKPRTLKNLVQGKERTREEPEWMKRYREKATETEIPTISILARLLPTGLFTVGVVTLSLLLAQAYVPPSQQARLFPDTPPAAAAVMAILGINFSIYCMWKIPQMWSFMNKYFIAVVLRPKAASMLLTPFSHQEFAHMALNMIVVWFLGVRCEIIKPLSMIRIDC